MAAWGRIPVVLAAGSLLLAGCAGQGTAETDRQAKTLADAISYPRQYSGEGFARAALSTPLGQSPSFSVLEVTEFDAESVNDQTAYLVIRIRYNRYGDARDHPDQVDVCYGMAFNYYGIIDKPKEVGCPDGARPITYAPPPKWEDAAAFESALTSLLAKLPKAPSERRVENTLFGSWLLHAEILVDDTRTNLGPSDPRPTVQVRGDDVAIAIHAGPECLLGSRVQGTVTVRRPPPPVANCTPSFDL